MKKTTIFDKEDGFEYVAEYHPPRKKRTILIKRLNDNPKNVEWVDDIATVDHPGIILIWFQDATARQYMRVEHTCHIYFVDHNGVLSCAVIPHVHNTLCLGQGAHRSIRLHGLGNVFWNTSWQMSPGHHVWCSHHISKVTVLPTIKAIIRKLSKASGVRMEFTDQ